MNQPSAERLYHLLPAIYRQRDAAEGEPLRALLAVMETELQAIEADIEGLYENWFIETCEEWVVPYIADLLGVSNLSDQESTRLSHRSYVANTIAYRRRKGTPAILENITMDVANWRSKVVEGFEGVSVTQPVNHVRADKGRTLDIRNKSVLDQLNSPFDAASHTVDVRRITSQYSIQGQSNVLNLGLFVWRLQSYPIRNSPAAYVSEGCYTVHPLKRDMPLFNRPQTKTDITQRTEVIHLPCPLSVETLAADLKEYTARYKELNQQPPNSNFYGPDRSFNITRNGRAVLPNQLVSLRLEDWQRPALEAGQVAIDVERGRLVLPDSDQDTALSVSYCYGFSSDLGGGPYDRQQTLANLADSDWLQTVAVNNSLERVLADWRTSAKSKGVIQILDNGVYGSRTITLPASSQLTLESADGNRPAIQSPQIVIEAAEAGASLILNGFLLKGSLIIRGNLNLTLIHCTVLGGIEADQNVNLQATIAYSIVGPLRLPDQRAILTIQDSIVDSRPDATTIAEKANTFAIAADEAGTSGPVTTLERTTVFGQVNLGELPLASNVIFTAPVTVQRQYSGGIRFSYIPSDSATPPRYRCQPDLWLHQPAQETSSNDRDRLLQPIPRFTSVTYGEPGYAQLSQHCAQEISTGADDGSEMGVFHLLHQPQRRAYLQLNLEEYVPSGLDIGIFYIT
ncbi:phage tail protein [Leptolyngbya sp. GGD]|uniref:phage tail protein n=1 Tax=Leptolyngbya sp. GGD TaxID=2997907 RepID=UPI00227B7AC7|nr:phage tail protein [Leptolyngbya sp. GGD]MCY6493367.1 phage tail protein [Leptolyngbya sp. GGD]